MIKKYLNIVFLFLGLFNINSATYYVATNGNDSADGSVSTPWLTIQKAANTMLANDSVIVNIGSYNEVVSIARGTNTYTANGFVSVYGFNVQKTSNTISGFDINGTGLGTSQARLTIRNGASNCLFTNITMTGGTETATVGPLGVQCFVSGTYSTNCVFTDIRITNINNHAFAISGRGHIVTNCIVVSGNGWDVFSILGSDMQIINNYIAVSNNVANGNHSDLFQAFGNTGAIATNNIIEKNIWLMSNYQIGSFSDDGLDGRVSHLTVRNNLFVGAPGLTRNFIANAPDMYFYNNTFYKAGAASASAISFNYNATGHCDNGIVLNNIFYLCDTTDRSNSGWYGVSAGATNVVANYNIVWGLKDAGTNTFEWNQYGFEANGINGSDPLFFNADNGDFRLLSASPARGVATNLSVLFTTDITGTTRTSWDMGAYEFNPNIYNTIYTNRVFTNRPSGGGRIFTNRIRTR